MNITERNGKFGVWVPRHGFAWFDTLEQACRVAEQISRWMR
jgi:hypothetical protein